MVKKVKDGKLVVYPKQWPDTRVDKPEIDKDEPVTPHLGHEYRLTKKFSEQTEKPKSARETFAKRFKFTRAKHMPHPAPIKGGHYKTTPQMEKPHYEEYDMNESSMTVWSHPKKDVDVDWNKHGAKFTVHVKGERVSGHATKQSAVAAANRRARQMDESKTYSQFVAEAAKRGRPRKLRPGEEADTLHIQDQLNKLTHPNHVEVHFKDGSKHRIPREHANMAIHHLNSLKPIERADHAEHMAKSHNDFYHVLSRKSIPEKKKGISLAGPKLRKEEAEIEEDYEKDAAETSKKYASYAKHEKALSKSNSLAAQLSPRYRKDMADRSKQSAAISKKYAKKATTGMDEEVEQIDELKRKTLASYVKKAGGTSMDSVGGLMYQAGNADPTAKDNRRVDLFKKAGKRAKGIERAATRLAKEEREDDDGWYAHKEMHGSKAISKEDWKKGVRPKKSMKKEEAEQVVEWGETKKAITGPHAKTSTMAITPPKIGYKGKTKKPKVQELHREEKASFSQLKSRLFQMAGYSEDYKPLETGKKLEHPQDATVAASSRKQGGDKPEKMKDPTKGKYTQKEVK